MIKRAAICGNGNTQKTNVCRTVSIDDRLDSQFALPDKMTSNCCSHNKQAQTFGVEHAFVSLGISGINPDVRHNAETFSAIR